MTGGSKQMFGFVACNLMIPPPVAAVKGILQKIRLAGGAGLSVT